jgi:hypothetical protein
MSRFTAPATFDSSAIPQRLQGSERSDGPGSLWVRRSGEGGRHVLLVDTGVYTRNRAFRMLHSRKFGKPTALAAIHTQRFQPPPSCPRCPAAPAPSSPEDWLLASLVVPYLPCGHLPPSDLLALPDDRAQPPLKLGFLGEGR